MNEQKDPKFELHECLIENNTGIVHEVTNRTVDIHSTDQHWCYSLTNLETGVATHWWSENYVSGNYHRPVAKFSTGQEATPVAPEAKYKPGDKLVSTFDWNAWIPKGTIITILGVNNNGDEPQYYIKADNGVTGNTMEKNLLDHFTPVEPEASEVERLQAENAMLREQVAKLQAENARLTRLVKDTRFHANKWEQEAKRWERESELYGIAEALTHPETVQQLINVLQQLASREVS